MRRAKDYFTSTKGIVTASFSYTTNGFKTNWSATVMASLASSAELTATDFDDFLRKLRDARAVILQSKNEVVDKIEDTEFPVIRDQIAKVCAVLEHKSDAFAIVMNCSLTSEALLSLCKDTFSPFESLVTVCMIAGCCGCTKHLRDIIFERILTVNNELINLVGTSKSLCEQGALLTEAGAKSLALANGRVTEALKALKKIPPTNKASVKREILASFKVVKDVCNDVHDLIKDFEQAEGADAEKQTFGMEDDDLMMGYDDTLDANEYNRSKASIGVFGMGVKCLQKSTELLNGMSCKTKHVLPKLDDIVEKNKALTTAVNEFGVVMFPPQKISNVRGAGRDVLNRCTEYLSSVEEAIQIEGGENNDTAMAVIDSLMADIEGVRNDFLVSPLLQGDDSLDN